MKPCSCWTAPVSLHDGHCCFAKPPRHDAHQVCHEAEGVAARAALGLLVDPMDGPDCLVCHPIDGPAVPLVVALADHRVRTAVAA